MRKLKAVLLSVCLPVGMLGGVGAIAAVVAPTAAHATGYCGVDTEIDNTGLYSTAANGYYTGSDGFPWYGDDENTVWVSVGNGWADLLAQNQTPSGDPGYGFSSLQKFTVCYSGDTIYFLNDAAQATLGVGNTVSSSLYGELALGYGDLLDNGFTFNCSGEETILYSDLSSVGNINYQKDYANSGLTEKIAGMGLSGSTTSNAGWYIYGLCGYPFP